MTARYGLFFYIRGMLECQRFRGVFVLLFWFLLMWPLYFFYSTKIVNIEVVVVVVKEGKSDGWIQPSSSSSGRKCEDAALPCSHFVGARKSQSFSQSVVVQAFFLFCFLFLLEMGFNCVGAAQKAAPLLGLWPACVLMTLNATGINNRSIQALAGLGCTNRFVLLPGNLN